MADYSQYFPSGEAGTDFSRYFPPVQQSRGPGEVNATIKVGDAGRLVSPEDRAMADPTRDMSQIQRATAGWGKFISGKGQGIQQRLGIGDQVALQSDIDQSAALDRPLTRTVAGFTGNLLGGGVTSAPALAMPGANSLLGATLLGGVQGATDPVHTGGSLATNTIGGMAGGLGGQVIGNKLSQVAQNRISNLNTAQGQNTVRDATLRSAQDAGYVVPGSAVKPTWVGNRLESIAGKAALGQEASHRNQLVTNNLARKELGIPENQAISIPTLESIRKTEGQVYAQVSALSKNATDALDALKQARSDATLYFKHYDRSGDPASLNRAQQAAADSKLWETFLESEAVAAGKPDLVTALRAARQKIAKTYDVERALNTSTGDVSATVLARAVDQGRPLSGGAGNGWKVCRRLRALCD